jgi:hypothetical protein
LIDVALTCIVLIKILESVIFLTATLTNTKFYEFILWKWYKMITRWNNNEMKWQRDEMTMWNKKKRNATKKINNSNLI